MNLDGTSLIVTGGTGSFGKRFVRRVLQEYSPARLVVYSRDELKQFEMRQTFPVDQFPRHCQLDVEQAGCASDAAMIHSAVSVTRHLTPDTESLCS